MTSSLLDHNKTHSTAKGTAVVTGASAGIGKIYADRLAQEGYDMILVARRGDRLHAVAEQLKERYGVQVQAIVADLAQAQDLERLISTVMQDESITFLVNNAGTSTLGSVASSRAADLQAMVALNIVALTRITVGVIEGFKQRNRGTIVNVGSVLGFHSLPISSIYSGTKGYVMNFTRGLQDELAETDIIVQLVAPAAIATDIWEISGVPLSNLDPATVMTAEDCVDASLAGLALGENITLPSVEDTRLWEEYDAARLSLLTASQTSQSASRYRSSEPK